MIFKDQYINSWPNLDHKSPSPLSSTGEFTTTCLSLIKLANSFELLMATTLMLVIFVVLVYVLWWAAAKVRTESSPVYRVLNFQTFLPLLHTKLHSKTTRIINIEIASLVWNGEPTSANPYIPSSPIPCISLCLYLLIPYRYTVSFTWW